MKNRIKIFLIALMAVSVTSCEDYLDRQPLGELSADQFWNSAEDAELWMLGMHDAAQLTFDDNMYIWGEARSDNAINGNAATSDDKKYLHNLLDASCTASSWNNLYRTISMANYGLKYIPNLDETDTVIEGYLAECLTMRALMYFYAIRVWGDVPLMLEPYEGLEGQSMYHDRTPVIDVMNQIKEDLELAIEYFDESVLSVDRVCIGAAYALQADVCLWNARQDVTGLSEEGLRREYQTVIDNYYNLVNLGYALAGSITWSPGGDWKEMFEDPTTASEAIFFVAWDAILDGECGITDCIAGCIGNANSRYKYTFELWDALVNRIGVRDNDDLRDNRLYYVTDMVYAVIKIEGTQGTLRPADEETYGEGDVGTSEDWYTHSTYNQDIFSTKYSVWSDTYEQSDGQLGGYDRLSSSTYQPWIPIYRLSDVALLAAEAMSMLSASGDDTYKEIACEIVNTIRKRAGYASNYSADTDARNKVIASEVTASELEALIIEERQYEFYGEGKRWFDLRRTNRVIEVMDDILIEREYAGYEGDTGRFLFPLADEVFEANPSMQQNSPYNRS